MDRPGFSPADELARFEPVLRDRAHRLIGPRLRPMVAPSDLIQEISLIAVRRFAEIAGRPPRMVLAWLLRSMQYRLMRHVRDHRRELVGKVAWDECGDPAASSSLEALDRIVRDEVRDALEARIGDLPESERRVIALLYKERRTTAEAAAALGRTEGAVRALHQRAVRRLREQFGDLIHGS